MVWLTPSLRPRTTLTKINYQQYGLQPHSIKTHKPHSHAHTNNTHKPHNPNPQQLSPTKIDKHPITLWRNPLHVLLRVESSPHVGEPLGNATEPFRTMTIYEIPILFLGKQRMPNYFFNKELSFPTNEKSFIARLGKPFLPTTPQKPKNKTN